MTARGDSLGCSRNPGSNYYAGLTHQSMIDLGADDAAKRISVSFAVGRQSRWRTTTRQSAPLRRISTFGLAVGAACALYGAFLVKEFRHAGAPPSSVSLFDPKAVPSSRPALHPCRRAQELSRL